MRLLTLTWVLAFSAIPTLASAHGGNTDPNAVHACIGNVSKIVRVVGVGGSCISAPPILAETPAHWTIQGPQGAPGAKGINGVNGTNGTNGMNGTNGTSGTSGTNGTNGTDGTSVSFVGYFVGNQNGCPNGGAVYTTGNPPVNVYVCNGVTTGTTRPDGPCFDNAKRYVDCGNGTMTDTVTGLVWLKDASCLGSIDWTAANVAAGALATSQCGLTDGSSPGDWRLPTRDEWNATMARAVVLGCTGANGPALVNNVGTACLNAGGGTTFVGVTSNWYWTGTAFDIFPISARFAGLSSGNFGDQAKFSTALVWPVRVGSR